MQHDPNARTQITEVPLPAELTEPLPEDASRVTVAARTAAETALGVHGVHHLGNLLARAADRVRSQFGRSAGTTGVQVDEEDGALDVVVSIVVEYPEPVVAVADEVRRQVREAVSQLGDGTVTVDVRVLDVHGPFDDEPSALDRAVESGKDAVDRAKTAASDIAADAQENAADVAERARDAAARAVDRAGDAADTARAAVADATDRVREVASDTPHVRSSRTPLTAPAEWPPMPPTRRARPSTVRAKESPTLPIALGTVPTVPVTRPPTPSTTRRTRRGQRVTPQPTPVPRCRTVPRAPPTRPPTPPATPARTPRTPPPTQRWRTTVRTPSVRVTATRTPPGPGTSRSPTRSTRPPPPCPVRPMPSARTPTRTATSSPTRVPTATGRDRAPGLRT